jgi:peptidyl-prolyl cis-trans isomerase C
LCFKGFIVIILVLKIFFGLIMAATAHALHILVKHKDIAEDIIKRLAKGAKFQTLAKKIFHMPIGQKRW